MTLQELKKKCLYCHGCSLCEGRHNLVFGVGNEKAEIMLIGEGPGEQEDLKGEPFVGPAGHLLDTMLESVFLHRSDVYIANIVKCRPPRNRDPLPEEQEMCRKWLNAQLSIIRPRIIVCLGRIAAQALIKEDFRITKEHGLWSVKDGALIVATYHPSALLRDVRKRPEAFQDWKEIRSKIDDFCIAGYDDLDTFYSRGNKTDNTAD